MSMQSARQGATAAPFIDPRRCDDDFPRPDNISGLCDDSSRSTDGPRRSIDELDLAIRALAREMSTQTYRLLVLVRIVEDHDGTPLDVGRKQRVVSTPLRRALWSRDRFCRFPGCRDRRYLDAHHLEHWGGGDTTEIGNLMLLCSYHHRLVHEGGFTIRLEAGDRPVFVRPDGRIVPSAGYRIEDMIDDEIDAGEMPSAEGWARDGTRNPSAEVRERRAPYLVLAATG